MIKPTEMDNQEKTIIQQGLQYDVEESRYFIRELEVSIHNNCNLQCNECGFYIPHQKRPYLVNPVSEIANGLNLLKNLDIFVKILVVVGGEPLLDKITLGKAVKFFKQIGNVGQLEVVTNGLYPQGLSKNALQYIDQFTISKYFQSDALVQNWQAYITKLSPNTIFNIREKTGKWDKWWGDYSVDADMAQAMYDRCFYRRHCVTIERGRLFPCSRIAKEGNDGEGLELVDTLTFQQVEEYLNSPCYFPSCLNCTPMMGLPKVKGGIQPDNRIEKLVEKAIIFLEHQLNS